MMDFWLAFWLTVCVVLIVVVAAYDFWCWR